MRREFPRNSLDLLPYFASFSGLARPKRSKFPVLSHLAGNLGNSETSSLVTLPSSGESCKLSVRLYYRYPILAVDKGSFKVSQARLAPVMISTSGHRVRRWRQRTTPPALLRRIPHYIFQFMFAQRRQLLTNTYDKVTKRAQYHSQLFVLSAQA